MCNEHVSEHAACSACPPHSYLLSYVAMAMAGSYIQTKGPTQGVLWVGVPSSVSGACACGPVAARQEASMHVSCCLMY